MVSQNEPHTHRLRQAKELFQQLRIQTSPAKKTPTSFLQLIGQEGSGCRRLALDFVKPQQKGLWVSPEWRLNAPLLWQIAQKKRISLVGLDCPQEALYRKLWRELYECQIFDFWILDSLRLKEAHGCFLKKLLAHQRIQVIVIENYSLSFCQRKAVVQLSNDFYKISWIKPASLATQYHPATYFQEVKLDLCSL